MNAALFSDLARSGVYTAPTAQRDKMEAAAAGFAHFQINLAGLKSKSAVLNKIGRALKFPPYYGKNFDALNDCLSDLEWQPANGYVLFVDGAQLFHDADPKNFAILLEVFQSAADAWRDAGKPFWVLLDISIPDVQMFCV
ncbi:MAG: hypothetical protein H6R18_967 [Proteobacteria bacterium]|nr:hypothetical protein [Pseudomonadota bacterium]